MMEENSDTHMETDVSSTTEDVLDTQEVTGSNGEVEMTIIVEKVNEGEATSNMESDAQLDTTNNVSSGSHTVQSSQEELQSQIMQKSPNNNNVAAQSMLSRTAASAQSASPIKVTSIISPVKSFAYTSSNMTAGTADSSTRMDSTSHSKDRTPSKEISEKYHVQSTASPNTKKAILMVKSPIKELSAMSPIKNELQKQHTFQIIRSPPKDKLAEKDKTTEEQKKTFQATQRSAIKSPPIKLVRKLPIKELKIQSAKEIQISNTANKLPDKPIKENECKDISFETASLIDKEVEIADVSNKESQIKDSPIKESLLKESPIKTIQLKDSPIKESQLMNSPIKETLFTNSPIKENHLNNSPTKGSHLNNLQIKASYSKSSPIKEIQLENSSIKQSQSKISPIQETKLNLPTIESYSKDSTIIEAQLTNSAIRESQSNDKPTKNTQLKDSPSKDPQLKDSPTKKLQLKDSPTKEKPAEESTNKVTHSKDSPIKEIFLKGSPIKEAQSKDPQIKNSILKDTPINEIMLPETTVKEINLSPDASVKEIKLPETTIQEAKLQVSTKTSSKELSKKQPDKDYDHIPKLSQSVIIEPQKQFAIIEPMDVETEASNDSQPSSIASEKEHNRSISRELKSLIKSAKESKIITECNQVTSKTRKSRTNIDTSLNTEPEVQDVKKDSQAAESDKPTLKRSMRSQNPEFVTKCKQFLNSVTSKVMRIDNEPQSDSELEDNKQKREHTDQTDSGAINPKKKKVEEAVADSSKTNMLHSDQFCWRCHWQLEAEPNVKQPSHPPMYCTVCVRSYHYKCLTVSERKDIPGKNWVCPDCLQILLAESSDSRSPAMKKISLGMLCDLLKYAVERMEALNGVEPFLQPVDRAECPEYDKVVVHPMDLSQMRENIAARHYGSTEAFVADAQWILHNSIIFNACEQTFTHSKLTTAARSLVRTCRAEMSEIETCPECYAGAHSRNLTYFTDVCSTPHMILWAKLKGFPYWPAKAVAVNNSMVDVRFFGQHDKSWVPVKDCYLYSEKDPNTTKHKKLELMQCRQEAEVHIRNICRKYGTFVYAPFKTVFDSSKMTEQLKMMIPSFEGEVRAVTDKNASFVSEKTRRSTSKSSKSSCYDGNVSESEDASMKSVLSPKEEKETKEEKTESQEPDTSMSEKNKTMVDVVQVKDLENSSRKRRRSAVTVPLAESTPLKKKKTDDKETEPGPIKESAKGAKKSGPTKDIDSPKNTENKSIVIKEVNRKTEGKSIVSMDSDPIKTTKETCLVTKEADTVKRTGEKSQVMHVRVVKISEQKPSSSKEIDVTKNSEVKVAEITKRVEKSKDTPHTTTDKVLEQNDDPTVLKEQEELRVTPIKLVALPRANKQTPKLFTTAKVTKSTPDSSSPSTPTTPSTPVDEERSSTSSSSSKRSKISKADKFIITEQKHINVKSSRRHSRSNRSQTSTPKSDKTDKSDKGPDSSSEASTSKEKPKKNDTGRSLLKKNDLKQVKDEKNKKSEDDLSLAAIARENRGSISGYPLISNVISLSSTTNKSITSNKTTKTTAKSIEISIEASSNNTVSTPTSTTKLNVVASTLPRHETSSLVGRVGVKAFARMTSPDINDEVQVDIKPEPVDLDEVDQERQLEKLDLMSACKLQPVMQTQSLRDVRMNKVVVPVMKKTVNTVEPRPRAKKSFPQSRRSEGSELNGKNSMVYIPIQPPNTQPPTKTKPGQHGITMPASVTAGPRPSAPVISTNNIVNTVTTPLRPNTTTLSSPSALIPPTTANVTASFSQSSTVNVPTVGPTTVHTVPLMTSVNGQWMFSLQPVMSVGGVDAASSPPMVNGIVPMSTSSQGQTGLPHITTISRTRPLIANAITAPSPTDSGGPEMPRLQQRPLTCPVDATKPYNPSLPTVAGPVTAKLNQCAAKLTDFFRNLLEDSIEKLNEPLAQVTALKIQLEQARWRYQQDLIELKSVQDLFKAETLKSFETEKHKLICETRKIAQLELEAAVRLTKSKQWCANCQREAHFYCCWNTSYCDYNCQRAHWNSHFSQCTQDNSCRQLMQHNKLGVQDRCQVNSNCNSLTAGAHSSQQANAAVITAHVINKDGVKRSTQQTQTQRDLPQSRKRVQNNSIDKDASESRQQRDHPPKSVPSQTPCLTTVGGKPAPMRVFTDASGTQKTSIIVSMIEDTSGNSTIKCLGTYKAPAQAQASAATQKSQLLINKQLANDDCMSKKTVTSGGYLIVGNSGNTSSVITPATAKRPHAQLFS